jgi:hypothetical protein
VQDREGESLRHDPDDRVGDLVDSHRPAQDPGVASELTLPLVIGENEDGECVGALVFGKNRSAEQRGHSRQVQPGRGDRSDAHQLCGAVPGDQISVVVAEGAQLRDRLHLATPLDEVVPGGAGLAESPGPHQFGIGKWPVLDDDDAISTLDRHIGIQEEADDRKVARANGHRDRHPGDGDEREPGVFHEHPEPELHVQPGHLLHSFSDPTLLRHAIELGIRRPFPQRAYVNGP